MKHPAPVKDVHLTDKPFSGQEQGETLLQSNWRLQESAQRLQLALESGGLGSWDLDLEQHRYRDISDIWKAHFGLPVSADLEGQGFSQDDFLALVHPDDRDQVRAAAQSAVEERVDYQAEYRCIWPDGSVHWICGHGRLLYDAAGEPCRMIGVAQNITARKAWDAERAADLAEAEARADRDPLTGLLNHRAFHRSLEEETERAGRAGTIFAVAMLDVDGFKFFNDAHGHAAGDLVLRRLADRLREISRSYDTLARFGGDEFVLLLPGVGTATAGDMETRLRHGLDGLTYEPDGQTVAIPITVSVGVSLLTLAEAGPGDVLQLADARLAQAKTGADSESQADGVRARAGRVAGFSMLDALVAAVDNKDRYTRRHSEDVMHHCLTIANLLDWSEWERQTLAMAALLHDVGKIGVPDAILRKPSRLTETEMEAVRQHPQMGAALVSTVRGLEGTLDAVRYHHERWDGGGYPTGLRGEATPPIARLMAVADAYSAMTMDRPYRKGMGPDKAAALLEAGAGSQWDPTYVDAFLGALKASLSF